MFALGWHSLEITVKIMIKKRTKEIKCHPKLSKVESCTGWLKFMDRGIVKHLILVLLAGCIIYPNRFEAYSSLRIYLYGSFKPLRSLKIKALGLCIILFILCPVQHATRTPAGSIGWVQHTLQGESHWHVQP